MDKKKIKEHLFILILCGGGGTRLWPRSRKETPKQFVDLLGEKTIFVQTMERARRLTSEERIFIITNADYVDEVYEQGKVSLKNVIAEPQKKDTALAMAVGAAVIEKIDPEAVIVNFAADHLISPMDKFLRDMTIAAELAQKGEYLVTVGIKPTFPHTGFGYIHAGKKFTKVRGKKIFKVESYKEKPDLSRAKRFLKSGKYYWNANLYTWRASAFLEACKAHAPAIFKGAKEIQKAWGTEDEQETIERVYNRTEGIAVDYAVSEKADNLLLVPASFDWNDLGDWEVVWDMSKKDKDGNVVIKFGEKGEFLSIDSRGNLVQYSDQIITLVGVEDMIIIDTPDAILICHKDKAESVKKMVKLLKKTGRQEYL